MVQLAMSAGAVALSGWHLRRSASSPPFLHGGSPLLPPSPSAAEGRTGAAACSDPERVGHTGKGVAPRGEVQDVRTGLFPAPTIVAPKAWEPATRVDAAHALTTRLPYVLLVEDNPGDIRLVREAFARGPVSMQLTVAEDGLEALTMLQRAGRKPDLILLDLNLPALDGRSVLRRIKSDPGLLRIPVIVLTTSNAPQDVWSAYHLHANCYLVKPADFVEFERSLHRLIEFWAGVAHLPGG